MKLLVTGGAGYIGSIVAQQLLDAGHEVVVLDDLSRGHRAAVPEGARLVEVDLLDDGRHPRRARRAASTACCTSPRSRSSPSRSSTRSATTATTSSARSTCSTRCATHGVRRLVFSSTCATYGEPETVPIAEDEPTAPVNAYGDSKLAVDRMIGDECRAHGLGAASLRYFNVAGASGRAGRGPRARRRT